MVAFALPGALLILGTAVMLLGLAFGIDPLWRVEPLTLAEAAALRDDGQDVRLIHAGENPNAPTTVRAELLRNDPLTLTPLEAAAGSDRPDISEVLLEHGPILAAATWTRVVCLATAIEADEAVDLLARRRPGDASLACEHVQTPW